MDPATIAAFGIPAVNFLSGLFGGDDQTVTQASTPEDRWLREKLAKMGLAGQVGPSLVRQIESSPIRDRVMAMMQNRLAQPTQQFSPKDIFNPGGTGSLGGINQQALNQANANYKPGMGGAQPDLLKQILAMFMGGGSTSPSVPQNPTATEMKMYAKTLLGGGSGQKMVNDWIAKRGREV